MRPLPLSHGSAYSFVFWGACVIWILPEIVASFTRRSGASSQIRDRGSLLLIAVLWWVGIVASFALSLLVPQTSLRTERPAAFVLGIGLMLAGTAFRWYSARILGKYFTFDVATQTGQVLIETGPYRYIRHPSYAGALLTLAGFGFALGNWASLIVAVLCLSVAYAYRIRVEEGALSAALGPAYQEYTRRTWRLIPFLF